MKKIINWTFGGFFRTIGRTLAFLLLGGLLFYLLQISGFKLPSYLSIMKVDALVDESFSSAESRVFVDQQGTETILSWHDIPYTQSVSYPVTQMQFRLKATNGFRKDNTYRFKVSYLPNPDSLHATGIWFSDGTSSLDATCTGFVRESNGYYANTCTISPLVDLSSSQAIYVRFVFQPDYVTSIRSWVGTFVESQGVASTIENQTIELTNSIDNSTTEIINNQNENTQAIIDANKSCTNYDKSSISIDNKYMASAGSLYNSEYWGVTDYINVYNSDIEVLYQNTSTTTYMCFYNESKQRISCSALSSFTGNVTLPQGTKYIRVSINKVTNLPQFKLCKNGSQATTDLLEDDNVDESINTASDFFSSFTTDTHGLTGIVTAPLSAIESLTSATCSPLTIPLPYINQNLTLPCMRTIYENNFGSFMTIYDAVTLGIISYWILVRIFSLVKDFKNPEHDEIEVVDL